MKNMALLGAVFMLSIIPTPWPFSVLLWHCWFRNYRRSLS
jgi:hypothetical protein